MGTRKSPQVDEVAAGRERGSRPSQAQDTSRCRVHHFLTNLGGVKRDTTPFAPEAKRQRPEEVIMEDDPPWREDEDQFECPFIAFDSNVLRVVAKTSPAREGSVRRSSGNAALEPRDRPTGTTLQWVRRCPSAGEGCAQKLAR